MKATACRNMSTNTSSHRPLTGFSAVEDVTKVAIVIDQGNGLHIFQQHIAAVAMILAMCHPLQIVGSVVGLVTVLVVHLQPFAPAWHKGKSHKAVDKFHFAFAFVIQTNYKITTIYHLRFQYPTCVRIPHSPLVAHFVASVGHFTMMPTFFSHES